MHFLKCYPSRLPRVCIYWTPKDNEASSWRQDGAQRPLGILEHQWQATLPVTDRRLAAPRQHFRSSCSSSMLGGNKTNVIPAPCEVQIQIRRPVRKEDKLATVFTYFLFPVSCSFLFPAREQTSLLAWLSVAIVSKLAFWPSNFKWPSLAKAGDSRVISYLTFIVKCAYMCVFIMEIIDQVRFQRGNGRHFALIKAARGCLKRLWKWGGLLLVQDYLRRNLIQGNLSHCPKKAESARLHGETPQPDKLFFSPIWESKETDSRYPAVQILSEIFRCAAFFFLFQSLCLLLLISKQRMQPVWKVSPSPSVPQHFLSKSSHLQEGGPRRQRGGAPVEIMRVQVGQQH